MRTTSAALATEQSEFANAFNELPDAPEIKAEDDFPDELPAAPVGQQAGVGDWLRKKMMPGTYGDKKDQPESDRRKALEEAKKKA